jgi:putative membrane protein
VSARRCGVSLRAAAAFAIACAPSLLRAHEGAPPTPADFDLLSDWSARPGVAWPMLIAAGVYAIGLARVWRRAGVGHGISVARAGAFAGGLCVLVVALMSPLDAISSALFSVHMVQHLLLMLAAAPLLVLGTPEVALLWSLPPRWRGAVGRIENSLARSVAGRDERGGAGPVLAVALATGALWIWHMPQLYDLALRNDAVHTAEHTGYLVTSILFWATVLRLRGRERLGNGLRVFYVFAMALQGSILGALITFASRPLYAAYVTAPRAWGLEPLVDQQLAGLIMWVPPALLYMGVTAYLFVGWLKAIAARRARRVDRSNGPLMRA